MMTQESFCDVPLGDYNSPHGSSIGSNGDCHSEAYLSTKYAPGWACTTVDGAKSPEHQCRARQIGDLLVNLASLGGQVDTIDAKKLYTVER
jgi:hypothetical protein